MPPATNRSLRSTGLTVVVAVCLGASGWVDCWSVTRAGVIAVDAAVPLTLDAGGTSGDPAVYLIGSTAGYSYAAAGTVTLGSFSSSYNELNLENAGRMTIADGFNFSVRGNNSRLVIDGTIVGFSRSRLDMSLNSGANNRFFIEQNNGSRVEVRNGGTLATTVLAATSSATNASLTVDGSASSGGTNPSVLFLTGNLIVAAGSSLSVTVSNGGVFEANNIFNIGTLGLSVGSGARLNLNAGQDFSVVTNFTLDAGATLNLSGANSNLGTIATGRTVSLAPGGSLTGATLAGGLLQVGSFDAANLAINSGTLELSSGTLSMGSAAPLTLTATTSLTGSGTVSASVNLNGGLVDGVVDPLLGRDGIALTSDVAGSGTLTNARLSGRLDVGPGGVSLVDSTLAAGSSVVLDIAGTASGQYDTFSANSASDVSGGDLVVAFAGGFVPTPGDRWTLFSGGFDTADFSSITLPDDTELSGYELVAVPEPTSICLMCCAAGLIPWRRAARRLVSGWTT